MKRKINFALIAVLFILVFAGCSSDELNYDSVDMMDLEPLKDQFSAYFMMGNIAAGNDYDGTAITNQRLLHHYNVLTAENNMKPDVYGSSRSGTTVNLGDTSRADRFVNSAAGSGFKIVGHTLLWHQQIPQWQKDLITSNVSKEDAITIMNDWITKVVTRYKGKIYSWDVLNEVFPDGGSGNWKTAMRTNNPWFAKIGYEFVFYGFKAARLADPDAILYYNDYNMDSVNKSSWVRDMVKAVNEQWTGDGAYDGRLLIEGIGMQSHHNPNVAASSIKTSLDKFKPLGVKISISELDVLGAPYSGTLSGANKPKAAGVSDSASAYKYYDYFKLFLQYSDIIERVTFWGVYDEQSWRSAGAPLLFKGRDTSMTKPAYYKVIQALEERQ